MRKIGELVGLDKSERFVAFLKSQKIESEAREQEGSFGIWVYDEDLLAKADGMFEEFKQSPDAPRYTKSALKNSLKPPQPVSPTYALKSKRIKNTKYLSSNANITDIPIVWSIIIICVVLRLVAQAPLFKPYVDYFFQFNLKILDGQIWRLLTPIFLHGGLLHLFFNMFWVFDVGGDIEREEGKWFLGIFVVVTGTLCNTLQFLVSGPYFEGISGVVYAMIGYAWMMTRFKYNSRYSMSDMMMGFMVAWIFVGLMFDDLRIANTQHITGMILGLILGSWKSGYLMTHLRRIRKR